jgi:hypothetical protein
MTYTVRSAIIKIGVAAIFIAAPTAAVSIPGYAAADTPAVLPAAPPADPPPPPAPPPPAPPQQNYERYDPNDWYNAGADGGGGGGGG